MAKSTKPPANAFVATTRKVYNPVGFSHGYNFVFFFLFALGFSGFSLYSMPSIDVDRNFCGSGQASGAPGECYYYRRGIPRIGMFLHLGAILPASVLACFQFLPVIRHKAMMFHRINGYVTILMAFVGAAGGLMVARNAFGGGLDVQSAAGSLFIMFILALTMAYINIKRLQIEQHRAWMLRAWFYGGAIITARVTIFAGAAIITAIGGYSVARSCDWVDFTVADTERMLELYPQCSAWATGENPDQMVVVDAKWTSQSSSAAEVAASVSVPFGMAVWLAFAIHAVGIEIYLHLTPGEAERLRKISHQRQLAAGMKHPGSAGLTSDRLGDGAPWAAETRHQDGHESDIALTERPKHVIQA